MRIGLISSGTPNDRIPPVYGGGIQKYLWSLAKALNKQGHEVHIFTHHQTNQLRAEILDNIHIHRIPRISKRKLVATSIFGFMAFFRILKVQKNYGSFHVIHAQSRVSSLIIRSFLPRIPFIFTAHNWDVALTMPGKVLSRFSYSLLFLIEKRVYSQSDRIISLTKEFHKILLNRYKVASKKIHVVPNMIEISEVQMKERGLHPLIKKLASEPFLLFIGRLEKEKGIGILLQIFKSIADQDSNLKLVFIGGGSQKSVLKRRSIDLKIRNQVYILGNLHEKQLTYLLKTAKALILPSQFEIMPTVILEAWAAECPVIVNKYYGVQAFIHHKKTGLLFQIDNPEEMFLSIQELFNKEDLNLELIQNSKKLVQSKYAASQVVKQIIMIYKDLLKRCN